MYNYIMLRTQISLTEDIKHLLDDLSQRTGKSMSQLIREAVTAHYAEEQRKADFLAALEAAAGSWKDRDFDGESYVEALRTGRRLDEVLRR